MSTFYLVLAGLALLVLGVLLGVAVMLTREIADAAAWAEHWRQRRDGYK